MKKYLVVLCLTLITLITILGCTPEARDRDQVYVGTEVIKVGHITTLKTDLELLSDSEIDTFIAYWYQEMTTARLYVEPRAMYAQIIQVYQNELILRELGKQRVNR